MAPEAQFLHLSDGQPMSLMWPLCGVSDYQAQNRQRFMLASFLYLDR